MTHKKHPFRVIAGGLDYTCQIGSTRLGIIPLEAPAPKVDAVVIEQDTYGLLAVDSFFVEHGETLTQLANKVTEFVPHKVGGLVVKRGQPTQIFAIVHDLDLSPSWQEVWIVSALAATLRLARTRQLKSLGMAALGTVHGRLPLERFIELLVETVGSHKDGPEQIWLGIKRSQCKMAVEQLKHHCRTYQPL